MPRPLAPRERPDAVPGAQLRVKLVPEHWLSAGSDELAQKAFLMHQPAGEQ